MIARLAGELAAKELDRVVVDVGGVGYLIWISANCFYALPEPPDSVTLLIHTAVREDDISLYGFLTELEKRLFTMLLSVGKVGPKAAMALLSQFQAPDLLGAIADGNAKVLAKAPGIGLKTAERIVVDLSDKARGMLTEQKVSAARVLPAASRADADAVSALLNLGYRAADAERVVGEARRALGEAAELQDVVRAALKRLAKG
jgi:Holliday junction DNA helicase RuvA